MGMADIGLVMMPSGELRGATQDDDRAWKRYKGWLKSLGAGEYFTFSYRRPRSTKHHRKFFSLVTYVAENSDVYDNKAKALHAIKVAAGHCDFVPDPVSGGLMAVPKSIDYASLDQNAFEPVYQDSVNGVLKSILPHMNRASLEEAIEHVSRY